MRGATAGAWVALVLGLAPPASAQDPADEEDFASVDPYTLGDEKALDRAGYVSFAPVEWAEGMRTDQVREILGGIGMLWVETAHFRLGSSLATYTTPSDPREDDELQAEYARLKRKLARFRKPHNQIDPWMRLHLYAQRIEDAYAAFEAAFDLNDADFPDARGKQPTGEVAMGSGPYLGMPRKFTVLLLERTSTLARFTAHAAGRDERSWDRFPLPGGTMFLGVSAEGLRTYGFQLDAAMHALVASELAHNFVAGFRDSHGAAPLWLSCGLAHDFARSVDARFVPAVMAAPHPSDPDAWKWEPRVRGLVVNGVAPTWEAMLGWLDWQDLKTHGHLVAWSRVSWLLAEHEPTACRRFLVGVTEPLPDKTGTAVEAALDRERKAASEAFGEPLEDLDAAWTKYVKRRYPKH